MLLARTSPQEAGLATPLLAQPTWVMPQGKTALLQSPVMGLIYSVLLIRASAATAIVLLITGIAGNVGEAWAGVLSAFPITLFPFLIILHVSYGNGQTHTVIKNFPAGMGSLLVYTATVAIAYPLLGVVLGTLLGFALATVYLAGLAMIMKRRSSPR